MGLRSFAALAASAALSAPGFAQAGPDATPQSEATAALDDIVVTARRRAEGLQEAPLAVSALSSEQLRERSVTNVGDIAAVVPNLSFTPGQAGGGGTTQLFIRGVGQQDFLITNDPGVGLYVDGVYISRSAGSLFDVVDLERVEVVRGPQGTLFGRNTIGGAVSLVSKRPEPEFGGTAEVMLGSFDRLDSRLSINLPLADVVRTRFNIATFSRQGYGLRLVDGVRTGNKDGFAARGVMAIDLAEDVEFIISVDGSRRREESLPQRLAAVRQTMLLGLYNNVVGGPAGVRIDERLITGDRFSTFGTGESVSDVDVFGISGTLEWRGEVVGLKSITAFRQINARFARDNDNSPLPFFEITNRNDQDQISQELQLSGSAFGDRLTWIGGVFYFEERASDLARVRIAEGTFPAIGLDLSRLDDNRIRTESVAVFGEVGWRVADDIRLTLGARWTEDRKQFNVVDIRPFSGVFIVPPTQVNDRWTAFTPKAVLDWRPVEGSLLYASVSRGFKAGGFNGRPDAAIGVTPYEPETVTSYELGAKTELLDRRLRINGAVFHADYRDIQSYVNITRPDGSFYLTVTNAARARIRGFELEVAARPTRMLLIDASLGHVDARYRSVPAGVPFTVNSRFVETPSWSGAVGAELGGPVEGIGSLRARGDFSWRSRVYHDVQNSPEISQGPLGLLNARLTWAPPLREEPLELALFATNLTDEDYITFGVTGLANLGVATVQPGRPREWGLSARFRF